MPGCRFFLTFGSLSFIIKTERGKKKPQKRKGDKKMENNNLYKVVDRRDGTTYWMNREDALNAIVHDWNLEVQFDNGMAVGMPAYMMD